MSTVEEHLQRAATELRDLTAECGPVETVEFRAPGALRPHALIVVAHGEGVAQALLDLLPATAERRQIYEEPQR